jgi:hypothetical protein
MFLLKSPFSGKSLSRNISSHQLTFEDQTFNGFSKAFVEQNILEDATTQL